jgi:hypothetical protein
MVQVAHDAVEVDFDQGKARLHVKGLDVFDDHDLANSLTQGLGLPGAKVSFNVEWTGIVAMAQIENTMQNFKGSFLSTGATINWSAEEEGFQFQSEAPDPSRNVVSVLGREKNGVFFT